MATRSHRPKRPVTIVELPEFDQEAKKRLNSHTLRALHLLLAENPLVGKAISGYPGLLELPFAGHSIVYAVGSRFSKVYLIRFLDANEPIPPPNSTEGKLLRKALDALVKAGLLLAIREALRALWEIIKDQLL